MQVMCAKCSRPIALADVIESSTGRLSHLDCERRREKTESRAARAQGGRRAGRDLSHRAQRIDQP